MPVEQGTWIPIACRFVPNDQWFTTHADNLWKIEDLKRLLLSKCLPEHFEPAPSAQARRRTRRPVSPITFAPRDELSDAEDGSAPHVYAPQKDAQPRDNRDLIPRATTPLKVLEPSQYILVSFSTGQVMDNMTTLQLHQTRPHELLELHRHPYLTKLPRLTLREYIKPYFAVHLWAIKLDKFQEKEKKSATVRIRRKAEWAHRWMFIRDGRFVLTEDYNDVLDEHDLSLSALASIQDNQRAKGRDLKYPIEPPPASKNWPWVITLKFDANSKPQGGASTWLRRGSRDAGLEEVHRSTSLAVDVQSREKDYIFHLLAPSEQEYHSIVRVLHREARTAQSTFLSKRSFSPLLFASTPTHSESSSPEHTPPPSRSPSPVPVVAPPLSHKILYPEWRKHIVEKAQRAGLGDVGRPIVLARFGLDISTPGEDLDPPGTPPEVREEEPAEAEQPAPDSTTWRDIQLKTESDNESLEDDEIRSECEWDNWEADVVTNRVRPSLDPPANPAPKRYGPVTAWSSTADYSFPPAESAGPSLSVPSSTLTHYSSADSLIRHPVRQSLGSQPMITSTLTATSSPLIPHFDPDTYEPEGLAVPVPQQFYPDTAYPARHTSFDRGDVRRSMQRTAVPLSMAMPTITSTVTAGPEPDLKDKKKGKAKDKGKGKQRAMDPFIASATRRPGTASTSISTSRSITPGEARVETSPKPPKSKLQLSFAQVSTTDTASGGLLPPQELQIPSATSVSASSFESPRFAHPDSDEMSD